MGRASRRWRDLTKAAGVHLLERDQPMRTVWKFALGTVEARIEMPVGAEIVQFAAQGGRSTLWAIVDSDARRETRHFYLAGTGEAIPFEFNTYRGTCFNGPYVWHLFENTIPASN